MRPVEIRIMALVETGIMGPVEAGSGVGCPGFVRPRATPRCVNRRLRRRERAMATSPRRSTAFRAQGRHETKQAMQPAQRGIVALVETGIMGPVEAGSGVGCPGFVRPRATPRCVNRRLRRRERAMATSPRRSAAFRAQDGWRWQGWERWKGPRAAALCGVVMGVSETAKRLEAYSWASETTGPLSEPRGLFTTASNRAPTRCFAVLTPL